MRLALCLLTWNEVEGCRRDVPRLERSAFDEVFAIDGGSRDGTVEYLEGEGIPVYRQREPSLNAAYHDAIERTTCDAIVVFPPKGTIDPSATLAFRKLFEGGADLVVASRSLPGGSTEEDDRWMKPRKWGVAWLSLFTSLVWRGEGPRIRDVLHGFRGFKVDAFRKMAPSRSGLSIDLETVIRSYRLGLRRCEFAVIERPRAYGKTHFPIARTAMKLAAYLVEELRRTDGKPPKQAPAGAAALGPRATWSFFLGVFLTLLSLSPGFIGGMGYTIANMTAANQILAKLGMTSAGPAAAAFQVPLHGVLEVGLELPFMALGHLTTPIWIGPERALSAQPVLFTALLGTLAFVWAFRLAGSRVWALVIGLSAVFATILWPYAYIGLETSQSLCLIAAAYIALESGPHASWSRTLAVAVVGGLAVSLKINGIFLVPAVAFAVFRFVWSGPSRGRSTKVAVITTLMAAIFVGNVLLRNKFWTRYGGNFEVFKGSSVDGPVTWALVMASLLFSVNKGFFVFSPICGVGMAGLRRAIAVRKDMVVFVLLALAGPLAGMSFFVNWADETWGARYLHGAVVPVLMLLAASRAGQPFRPRREWPLISAIVIGVSISFLGSFAHYGNLMGAATRTKSSTLENYIYNLEFNHIRFNAKLFSLWVKRLAGHGVASQRWVPAVHWWYERPADMKVLEPVDIAPSFVPQPILLRDLGPHPITPARVIWSAYFLFLCAGVWLLVGLSRTLLKVGGEGVEERLLAGRRGEEGPQEAEPAPERSVQPGSEDRPAAMAMSPVRLSAGGFTFGRTSMRKHQGPQGTDKTPPKDPAVTGSPDEGRRPNGARQAGLVLAALLAVLALTNFNVVFLGQTLVASANYSPFDDRVTHLRPTVIVGHAFANWHDLGATWWQWEPAGVAFSDAFRRGEVPLWDPAMAGGVDAHVSLNASQYFPPYLPVLLLGDTPALRDAYYLAIILAAGLGMAGLLLRNGFHPASATAGGMAYMLCGAVTQTANSNLGQATAMLPLMLLVTDWLLERPSGPRFAATAGVVATSILAGFLPVVFSGFLLVALLALAHAVVPAHAGTGGGSTVPRRLGSLVAAAGAGLLGLALAAFLVVPVKKASAASAEFHAWYTGLGRQAYSRNELLTLVSPLLSWDVNQTHLDTQKVFLPWTSWQAHLFYAGLVVMLLASLARPLERPAYRRLFLAFGLMSGVIFAKLFGLPPVQWLSELPVLRYTHFIPYFCGALAVGLSGLAACGVESIVCRVPRRRDLLAGAAFASVVLGGVALFALARGFNPTAPGVQYLRWAFELNRVAAAAVGILVLVWLRLQGLLAGKAAGFVAVGLVVLELGPLAYHGRYGRADVWRDVPEYVRFLQRDKEPFRIHSVQGLALTPNVFQAMGIQGIGSRAVFNQSRFSALVRSSFTTVESSSFIVPTQLLPTDRIVLDLLNVKYVVAHAPSAKERTELAAAGLVEVSTDGMFVIFQNPTCWPRAYLARRYRFVSNASAALEQVATLTGPDEVILEERPTFASGSGSASEGGTCRIAEYRADTVSLEVDSPGPGIAVLLDTFAPGWTAKVNGTPARIVPANSAFRGIEVPAGHSVVTMRYRTPGLRLGGAISGLALVGVALCLSPLARRIRRPHVARGNDFTG